MSPSKVVGCFPRQRSLSMIAQRCSMGFRKITQDPDPMSGELPLREILLGSTHGCNLKYGSTWIDLKGNLPDWLGRAPPLAEV